MLRQDTETFLRCLENAFRHFGGVTQTTNLDNLKAAVLKFDFADPQLNPKLLEFARHYGTVILPCLPRTPEHKGKVENSVGYVKGNALARRTFESLAPANQFLADWERTVADVRIHGTTKRQVGQLFAEEKKHLLPLPPSLFPVFREAPRLVHRDSYVEVAKAYYAAPPERCACSTRAGNRFKSIAVWNPGSSPRCWASAGAREPSKPISNIGWAGRGNWAVPARSGLRLSCSSVASKRCAR